MRIWPSKGPAKYIEKFKIQHNHVRHIPKSEWHRFKVVKNSLYTKDIWFWSSWMFLVMTRHVYLLLLPVGNFILLSIFHCIIDIFWFLFLVCRFLKWTHTGIMATPCLILEALIEHVMRLVVLDRYTQFMILSQGLIC